MIYNNPYAPVNLYQSSTIRTFSSVNQLKLCYIIGCTNSIQEQSIAKIKTKHDNIEQIGKDELLKFYKIVNEEEAEISVYNFDQHSLINDEFLNLYRI